MGTIDTSMSRQAFVKGGAGMAGIGLLGAAGVALADEASASAEADGEAGGAAASGMTASDYEGKWAFEIAPEPITDIAQTVEAELVVSAPAMPAWRPPPPPSSLACRPSSCRRRAW